MELQLEEQTKTALQEGILGCMVAATYVNGQPDPDDFDRIIDTVAGRELFLESDIVQLLKSQIALRYLLDEEEYLQLSCAKVTADWRRSTFTIACNYILEGTVSAISTRFLKRLKNALELKDTKDILEVLALLHKDKYEATIYSL